MFKMQGNGRSAQQLVKHADSEEDSPSPTSAPNSGDRGGRENIQASEFHVRWYWRVRSLSTHISPGSPRPGRPCPEPTCRGSERRLLPLQTASDTHRWSRGSDKIPPVSMSLSLCSVTAKNATAGSGLCLQRLDKRSMSSFSHLPFAIQAPLRCVPWGAGLPQLSCLCVDLQACRTPGTALLSPRPDGLSQNTHELLGLAFSHQWAEV